MAVQLPAPAVPAICLNYQQNIGIPAQFAYQMDWIYAFLFYIYVKCYNNFSMHAFTYTRKG
ncbi:hypothetical protein SAMN05661012_03895 [Chitinophaga sancti]|uniref:Uncharacterized protein n=1 Tax=Chitinophaga sancti TaxID=1004 RepID=A0A1K1RJK0_9BACT|nr:hypothetical protein SAMN05661012_03895 [Chitinophaga sancti]